MANFVHNMKLNRTYLFIAISSFALIILLIIQVNWIFQTAKVKEEMFNEKANMVLSRTTEALRSDKITCMRMGACMNMQNRPEGTAKLGKEEVRKLDSLFMYYMGFYNFHIDYTYVVAKPETERKMCLKNSYQDQQGCYMKCIEDESSANGLELKLILPDKKQYIVAEMGTLFISSVLLIIIVLVLFWRTILSLIKEKKMLEHTTDFLNNMTHEFKTPLTNIAIAGKMIQKDINIKQEQKIKHYSEIILEENEKLRLQVEQVLSMTALERGEIPIQKTMLDFHQTINDSLKCMGIQIENKKGTVTLQMNAREVKVMGDKTHLTNAICNLIDNALKYATKNPEVKIETYNSEKNLVVVISDNGIGIDKEYQKKIFDKYFRVPTGDLHNVKGFGLGLAYVKMIVELHEGKIDMLSEINNGTKFIITLPNA